MLEKNEWTVSSWEWMQYILNYHNNILPHSFKKFLSVYYVLDTVHSVGSTVETDKVPSWSFHSIRGRQLQTDALINVRLSWWYVLCSKIRQRKAEGLQGGEMEWEQRMEVAILYRNVRVMANGKALRPDNLTCPQHPKEAGRLKRSDWEGTLKNVSS